MVGPMRGRSMPQPRTSDFEDDGFQSPGSQYGDGFRVTVIFTTPRGTQAALRTAGTFAKDLGARIALVVAHEIPLHFPLDKPPVSIEFLARHQIRLVSESGVRAEEVQIEMFLCHDRRECLKRTLRPGSLVVVGGRRRRWLNKERRLERWLAGLGHRVVFADVETRNHSTILFRMRGWFGYRQSTP